EIHTAEEVIEIYAAMKELEKQLGEDFYRCHRGYLVNMAHITEYDNDSIRLSNGERVYLSRERYSEFVKGYMRYLRKEGGICV
ncbi:MAG: LytTR family transcriptional regulator DNA-binding domain-containing protein, partial [Lachnospiraceae bacterium]|nr:LytTR family transcriptional regulator DNA-binding domain-containing protein [Lachnospiraceae bacterium]